MNDFLILGVLLALVGIRALAAAVLVLFILRPARRCPACFRPTVPVRKGWLRPLARHVEWRWCISCGWEGLGRRGHRPPAARGSGRGGTVRPADASGVHDGDGAGH